MKGITPGSTMRGRRKNGFTLLELVSVVSIIMVLLGIMFPVFTAVRLKARKTRAKRELNQVKTAWVGYQLEYRGFPDPGAYTLTFMGPDAVAILRGTPAHPANTRQIMFLDLSTNTTYFCDPWGVSNSSTGVYLLKLDFTLNNFVSVGAAQIAESVAAWSQGPDKTSFTADDVTSWTD